MASESLSVIEKLINHGAEGKWTAKQAKNVAAFVKARGGEQMIHFWNGLSKTQNLPNIQAVHKLVGKEVVAIVREARGLNS